MIFSPFCDWFFDRLIWVLISGRWRIKIKNFKRSKNKQERKYIGLTVFNKEGGGTIYLDERKGNQKILIHELCHAVLGDILEEEARERFINQKDIDTWEEDRILEFEEYFWLCLSRREKRILKTFIDEAKTRFIKTRGGRF
jgi:excinuclease UvrABC ATPase subunit